MERGLAPFKELVVGEKVFRIPLYQRNYSWEERQLEDLWDDLTYLDIGKKHYFGTILMKKGETKQSGLKTFDVFEIIDGQQRITTVLILIKEMILQFKNLCKDPDSMAEIEDLEKNYLKYKDIYKLELLGDDTDFFRREIIDDQEYVGKLLSPSQERLRFAKKFYQEKFEEIKRSGVDYKDFLTQFKKKIDNLEIIRYPVETDSDGVLIFETVNDRGKVLSRLDKTKSFMMHMLYLSSSESPDYLLRMINERFANIYRNFEKIKGAERGDFLDEDAIQRYHFIIYEPTARGDKTSSQNFLEYLKNAARQQYRQNKKDCLGYVMKYTEDLEKAFIITDSIVSRRSKDPVGVLLNKLFALERVANFFPLLQASWIRFGSDSEKLREILRLVEVFTFRVYVVGRSRADTGEVLVDRLAFNIHNSLLGFEEIMVELKRMVNQYANDLIFRVDLSAPEFFSKLAKKDLKYFLFEYEKFRRGEAKEVFDLDMEFLSQKYDIELIWADTPDVVSRGHENEHEQFKNKLGNLTICTSAWKKSFGDKPFLAKKKEYESSPFIAQRELTQYVAWGKREILDREGKLIAFALERWHL